MKFIREISANNISDNNVPLDQEGFTLVWKENTVEIWVEDTFSTFLSLTNREE